MNINIVSNHKDIIDFIVLLKHINHNVTLVNGEFKECDLCIYDSEFEKQIQSVENCIKVEYVTKEKASNNFSISFNKDVSDYHIKTPCSFSGRGKKNDEFICDISAVGVDKSKILELGRYLNGTKTVKVFGREPLSLWCYCGNIDTNDENDLFVSSKCTVCYSEYETIRVLEAGGVPVTNSDIELPEELIYKDDLISVIDNLINNNLYEKYKTEIREIRNKVIKNHNPFSQWSNIFKSLSLTKTASQCQMVANERSKTLYF